MYKLVLIAMRAAYPAVKQFNLAQISLAQVSLAQISQLAKALRAALDLRSAELTIFSD